MRRTQFTGGAREKPAKEGRPSIRDLITGDLKRAFDPDERSDAAVGNLQVDTSKQRRQREPEASFHFVDIGW